VTYVQEFQAWFKWVLFDALLQVVVCAYSFKEGEQLHIAVHLEVFEALGKADHAPFGAQFAKTALSAVAATALLTVLT
jgi:hypothetical protein